MAILSSFPSGAGGGDTLSFTNIVVSASDWDDSSYSRSFPYEAVISLSGVTENHFPIVAFYEADDIVYHFMDSAQTGNGTVTIYAEKAPAGAIIIPSIACREMDVIDAISVGTLNETSWNIISVLARDGTAGNYWSVGDTKSVYLNGQIGDWENYIDSTFNIYIIGINHENKNGITFQGFKDSNGNEVALVDEWYEYNNYNGYKCFNLNHWGEVEEGFYNTNYGGWKGCDSRYDVIGSTDIQPSGYGSRAISGSRIGYDASPTTATNPVSNTLMSCLPNDLRAVMRPMTIYTDNSSTSPHNTDAGITTSIDYLPLLAEYELFGARTYANQYEQNYQTQYEYYADGGSKIKKAQLGDNYYEANTYWWLRSPENSNASHFCSVEQNGSAGSRSGSACRGFAPILLV